jgi:hypothetical protein
MIVVSGMSMIISLRKPLSGEAEGQKDIEKEGKLRKRGGDHG